MMYRMHFTQGIFSFRCDENGDYKKIQCLPSYGICHCVESKTGKAVHSTNTMIRGMPNCDSKCQPLYNIKISFEIMMSMLAINDLQTIYKL